MEEGTLTDASEFLSKELPEITPDDLHGMSSSDRIKGTLFIILLSCRTNKIFVGGSNKRHY